jgi:diphthamide synthase (EF-2-diphthine--ammonia ligase)
MGLILLTTFDATSRIIAHQDISIDTVIRQARHLDITLIGVPMHRGSSESYVQRIQRGIAVVDKYAKGNISSLVFGDLHLEHIKGWRDEHLGPLGYEMAYPLFNVPYATLLQDLEASRVPCVVTSSMVPTVQAGEVYDSNFRRRLTEESPDVDVFGENGEFHSEAQVWEVDRSVALGLK